MRKTLLYLVASVVLLSALLTNFDSQRVDPDFAYVCAQAEATNSDWTCDGIEPPTVIVTQAVRDHRWNAIGFLRGLYYDGEPYIFIRPDMKEEMHTAVVRHEIAHYILYYNDVRGHCEQEEAVRQILDTDDDTWRQRYDCLSDSNP